MDKSSKDIILKICETMVMKDVLNMRCLTKRYNRIISGYINKKFYLNFRKVAIWIGDCYEQIILGDENNINKTEIIDKVKDKIFLVENIYIQDIYVNDIAHIFKLFKSVKNIIIRTKQLKYDFLSFFQLVENIEINYKLDLEIFPVLENARYLTISNLQLGNIQPIKISDILKKLPNIERLVCDNIVFDVEIISKIKYLEIRYKYSVDYTEVIIKDLEEIILYYTNLMNELIIPHAKKITINEKDSWCAIQCLSHIKFNNDKLEYLTIKNNIHANAFMLLYGSLEFKSLKKIELGGKYTLQNNKIILLM